MPLTPDQNGQLPTNGPALEFSVKIGLGSYLYRGGVNMKKLGQAPFSNCVSWLDIVRMRTPSWSGFWKSVYVLLIFLHWELYFMLLFICMIPVEWFQPSMNTIIISGCTNSEPQGTAVYHTSSGTRVASVSCNHFLRVITAKLIKSCNSQDSRVEDNYYCTFECFRTCAKCSNH